MKKPIFLLLLLFACTPVGAQELSFDAIAQVPTRDVGVPTVSNVSITPSSTAVRIDWETDGDASSYIEYGPNPAYGSRMPVGDSDTPSSQKHHVEITGLPEFRTYHFRIRAQAAGSLNEVFSRPLTFMTLQSGGFVEKPLLPTPADFSAPQVSALAFEDRATPQAVNVTTREPSSIRLEYGTYVKGAPFLFEEKETSPLYKTLARMPLQVSPGSFYLYRITTQDRYGNRALFLGNVQTATAPPVKQSQDRPVVVAKTSKESPKNKELPKNKEIPKNKDAKNNKKISTVTVPKEWIRITHPIQLKVLFKKEVWRDPSTGAMYRIIGNKKVTAIPVRKSAPIKKTPAKKSAPPTDTYIPFYR